MPYLTRDPLDPVELLALARRDGDGGLTLFAGAVRNRDSGREVASLEYVAYESMAEKELGALDAELSARFPDARIVFRHRLGRLQVGELAVVIVAAAPHREEAFAACREAIEAIKARAPIWKREFGPDGNRWVDPCGARSAHESC